MKFLFDLQLGGHMLLLELDRVFKLLDHVVVAGDTVIETVLTEKGVGALGLAA